MPFVKLDAGIMTSSLWPDRDARDIFICALLMAEPYEVREPLPEVSIRTMKPTGFLVPPGWYGLVPAAGIGIIQRTGVEREAGITALETLADIDIDSRTEAFEGRRMVRVSGGFLVLNYQKYRDRDYTAAERSKRYREHKKEQAAAESSRRDDRDATRDDRDASRKTVSPSRNVTQAEVEAEVKDKTPATNAGGVEGDTGGKHNWVSLFSDDFSEARGGIAPAKQIGSHIKKLARAKDIEPMEIRPAWLRFLESDKAQFGVAWFCQNFGDFESGEGTPQRLTDDGFIIDRGEIVW